MLANTMRTLTAVPEIDHVLVISRDTGALAMARDFGARTLQEDGSSSLNTALKRATVVAQLYGARGVLVLPADLPLMEPASVQAVISLVNKPPVVVIAPDRRRKGTNALLVSPVGLIEYQFGPNSFERHSQQARKYRVRLEVCEQNELALDLDLPEDLDLLRQMEAIQLGD